jgi:hypothetical protein
MEDRLQDGRDVTVIASEAKQSIALQDRRVDCFVASLLAMTEENYAAAAVATTCANSCSRFDCER